MHAFMYVDVCRVCRCYKLNASIWGEDNANGVKTTLMGIVLWRSRVFLIERTTGKIRVASNPSNKAYLLYVKAEDGLESPRSRHVLFLSLVII